ncbi:olfactory receptor 5D18-like isoform X2 [Sphaerodactylus townsendi]|uniref:olfactory receptor 5D18-like isoform X2 n=1 Tax=Sphaerodactylus townsendi TaxID=933632 RepID=UPI00202654C2|nr:olfactory receptor 5D18-like isoform X2 [Sphaerodactylus townsendi]
MKEKNHTSVTMFILLGFTENPELHIILFLVFLLIYLVTLIGNIGIIILIRVESHLHCPMYFFLSHLSFVDICYSSSITPRFLIDSVSTMKEISLAECAVQMYLFVMFVVTESFILAVMAYDRYVAICNPLLYTAVMSRKLCIQLVAGSYIGGIVCALVHTCSAFRLDFCGPNAINHFFCDISPVLDLSCSDNHTNKVLLFIFATFVETSTIIIILMSYLFIITSVLKIQSNKGKYKAFSTCASHFTAISIFHATILFMYCQPNGTHSLDTDKIASIFYTMVIPMLNPIIYSLRNKEVKGAFRRLVDKTHF